MDESSEFTEALPESGLFPIRTVSEATGVNPVTLRAWERRYGLLKPKRTPKGHRLYSKDQIETIREVVRLLDQGMAISQVGTYLTEESRAALEGKTWSPKPKEDVWSRYCDRMIKAIDAFDAMALDGIYSDAMSLYPVDTVTERLTIPVLDALGVRWRNDGMGISTEHFFNAYLRNKLGARFHHAGINRKGPRLVAACIPGEWHETGLLLFCLSAVTHGFQLVYLGANMPLEELPEVVDRSAADAVVLSAAGKPKNRMISEHLPDVIQRLAVPLFIGGRMAVTHEKALASSGAIPVGNDIAAAVATIEATLKNQD